MKKEENECMRPTQRGKQRKAEERKVKESKVKESKGKESRGKLWMSRNDEKIICSRQNLQGNFVVLKHSFIRL